MALLKSDKLDPDMLDEQARALLDYTDARDLTFMLAWKPTLATDAAKP